jgi:hypothetical protein
VEHEERPAERGYILLPGVPPEILYEGTPDRKGPAFKLHFALPMLFDRAERFTKLKENMIRFKWSGARGDGPHFGNLPSRRQHRGSPEAVSDKETHRSSGRVHRLGCADDVADIAAEAVPPELTLAATKSSEIEAERADALLRQRSGHASRCQGVARACEAMGKDRVRTRTAIGHLNATCEHSAVLAHEVETFLSHRYSPIVWRISIREPLEPRAAVGAGAERHDLQQSARKREVLHEVDKLILV